MDAGVVVLDSGSHTVKAGYASAGIDEREPRVVTPTRCSVYPPGANPAEAGGAATLVSPVHRGAVTDWEALESIWHYTVFEQLGWIEGEEGGLMITAPLVWSRRDREVAAQVAFEGLNASGAFIADAGVCSLYSVGKTSGFAVDVGHGKIDVSAVYEGVLNLGASATCPHNAGDDLEARFRAALGGAAPEDEEGLRQLKEQCVRCPTNAAEEASVSGTSAYTLPDGRSFSVPDAVGMDLGACLYEPGRMRAKHGDADGDGLAQRLARLVIALPQGPQEQRRAVYDNVVVCGGAHGVPGLKERLGRELKQYSPLALPSAGTSAGVAPGVGIAGPSTSSAVSAQVLEKLPDYLPSHVLGVSTFLGAAVCAKVSVWSGSQHVTKADYDEQGPRAIAKCSV